jgi:phage-related protein
VPTSSAVYLDGRRGGKVGLYGCTGLPATRATQLRVDIGLDILTGMASSKDRADEPRSASAAAAPVKPVSFEGSSLKDLRDFPRGVKEDCGYQLHKVQCGDQPDDFRPMPRVGQGVEEIRVKDEDGIYRVMYTARFDEAVYVLHAFEKRTQQTADKDITLAKERLKAVLARRQLTASAVKKGKK